MNIHNKDFLEKMKKKYSWFSEYEYDEPISESIRQKIKKTVQNISKNKDETSIVDTIVFLVLMGANSATITDFVLNYLADSNDELGQVMAYKYESIYAEVAHKCNEIVLMINSKKIMNTKTINDKDYISLEKLYRSLISDVTHIYMDIMNILYRIW